MTPRLCSLLVACACLSNCADSAGKDEMAANEASKPRSMNERFNNRGKEGYYQDGEGNWKTNNNKRSSFESVGRSDMANQQYSGKVYQADRVEKSSWWGNQQYDTQRYAGNTSAEQYKTAATGVGQAANESGERSIFSRKSMTTRTMDHQSARESSQSRAFDGSPSARESQRADVQPAITDWKEQRSLQLKDTKSWLNK